MKYETPLMSNIPISLLDWFCVWIFWLCCDTCMYFV